MAKIVVKMTIDLVHHLSLLWYFQYVKDCMRNTPLSVSCLPCNRGSLAYKRNVSTGIWANMQEREKYCLSADVWREVEGRKERLTATGAKEAAATSSGSCALVERSMIIL
jgi:hypothetical protein